MNSQRHCMLSLWLLFCTYNLNRNDISNHSDILTRRSLDLYSAEYETFIIMGDFNTEVTQTNKKVFCDTYELKNLIKEVACCKNQENLSCIDLILINNPNSFQNLEVIETEIFNNDAECVDILNKCFSNALKNLEILEFNRTVTLVDNIFHPTLNTILKYSNHPSNSIKNFKSTDIFSFSNASVDETRKLGNLTLEKLRKILISHSKC